MVVAEWGVGQVLWSMVWFTLFFEISFVFLIWHRLWRPLILCLAILLHVGIGVFMGLDAFGAVAEPHGELQTPEGNKVEIF